jgi:hypothetical protein
MSLIEFKEDKKVKNFLFNGIFLKGDVTAGMETELQTAVVGSKENVDLPIQIRNSVFFQNLLKRTKNGEYHQSKLKKVQDYLENNPLNVWENSYVKLKKRVLNRYAQMLIEQDLLKDKRDPQSGIRDDYKSFCIDIDGEEGFRFPVSYLLKVALADFLGEQNSFRNPMIQTVKGIMEKFSNDNTSPEVVSFYLADDRKGDLGNSLGIETVKRFLLTQLLTVYSNKKLEISSLGQRVVVYHSPLTPMRQQYLNELIPDSFYRDLFISPCLSGWDKGEEKKKYMELCHLSLSRSRLNTIEKLKDAGIIKNNLIVLPNTSNTSLTNNGIHISISSRYLTDKLRNFPSKFNQMGEKYYSDLSIKIMEHFIPLITGVYSASPFRIAFHDFHPEKVLGFLPHELDFTNLRMIYRRWLKKCHNKRFGYRFTPVGPLWIDKILEKVLYLKGDFVPDYRVIDYFVSILGTETAHDFDGTMDNHAKLKKELHSMGVFDERLSFYSLIRGRVFKTNGYSGFESRFYSCFYDLYGDTRDVTNLQNLFVALAYKYIISGVIKHTDIPDDPNHSSERRQIFFGTALGIPTVYIKSETSNLFMKYILNHCDKIRLSRRYPGYYRVEMEDYRKALIKILKKDAADIIENLNISESFKNLCKRIEDESTWNANRLVSDLLKKNRKASPLDIESDQFNLELERYYREDLRRNHIYEGLKIFFEDFKDKLQPYIDLKDYIRDYNSLKILEKNIFVLSKSIADESISIDELKDLMIILLVDISIEENKGKTEVKWKNIAI